jgi:hypothetical protein
MGDGLRTMTEYHDGLPILPPDKTAEVADKLRIQIIGVRAGWSAWAARESAEHAAASGDPAGGDERWRELMAVDAALRAAETQLETALQRIAKEVQA